MTGREPFLPEFRWQGEPGQRTLWAVKARSFHLHELGQLGLRGAGPDRVYLLIAQPAESRTFKAVLGWRPRLGVEENLFQLGGDVSTN